MRFAWMKRAAERTKDFHTAYFAMVMSTGALAIAAQLLGLMLLAECLAWLNVVAFIIIVALMIARAVLVPHFVWADLTEHRTGMVFFTIVAAIGILGAQFMVVLPQRGIAEGLWFSAIVLWVLFTYTIITVFTVKEDKPALAVGINGGWLLIVVATQAVANLGALLAPAFGSGADRVLFLCLSLWLCGGMLYIWIISLIFYRYTFFAFPPSDLMPPYWINMGAMAISTLAGSVLIESANRGGFLLEFVPFLKGFTVFFWAIATWWIPVLVALGFWRHIYKKFPLSYDPLYWGAVFPIAMYTMCTFRLSQAVNLPFLLSIPRVFIYIALAAWLTTFAGFMRRTSSGFGRNPSA